MPYTARRIDPSSPQNLGDFSIVRRYIRDGYGDVQCYHYNSKTGILINRGTWNTPAITEGSRIYTACMKAIARLEAEEA